MAIRQHWKDFSFKAIGIRNHTLATITVKIKASDEQIEMFKEFLAVLEASNIKLCFDDTLKSEK